MIIIPTIIIIIIHPILHYEDVRIIGSVVQMNHVSRLQNNFKIKLRRPVKKKATKEWTKDVCDPVEQIKPLGLEKSHQSFPMPEMQNPK